MRLPALFFENYTKKSPPNGSTLRRNYLPNLFEQEMLRTIKWTKNEQIYIITDECTDPSERFGIGNFSQSST